MLSCHNPWAVIYAPEKGEKGSTNVIPFGGWPQKAAVASLAAECDRLGTRLMVLSSDLVFDGQSRRPYFESDTILPVSRAGIEYASLEAQVAKFLSALIVRCGPLIGPIQQYDFVAATVQQLASGRPVLAEDASLFSPTYIPHLIDASLDLLIDGETGFWHLANQCSGVTWAGLTKRLAELVGVPSRLLCLGRVQPRLTLDCHVLASARGAVMPSLEEALTHYASGLETDNHVGFLAA
jgi:dTDP-4-dehydrorhamnose reductase